MKTLVQAGTDAATLCAFDPAALPADVDMRLASDPVAVMEELRDAGALWFAEVGGDGTRAVAVLVDEPPDAADAEPD